VVALWLLLHDWIPDSVESAQGPIRSLYQLGTFVGNAAVLAALSFIAYLLGSMLRLRPRADFSQAIVKSGEIDLSDTNNRRVAQAVSDVVSVVRRVMPIRAYPMYLQLRTFVSTRLRETASALNIDDHNDVVVHRPRGNPLWEDEGGGYGQRPQLSLKEAQEQMDQLLVPAYVRAIAEDLPAVGVQLQAKNRDFWDTYDRQLAEAEFRYGIAPPLALIIVILAAQSGDWWWLFLLPAPAFLYILGNRHLVDSALTLVQAVVLKMVEPPVLERLREMVAKKQDEAKFVGGTRRP
jgi:hypothetical protein